MSKIASILSQILGVFGAFIVGRILIAILVTATTGLGFWALDCPLPVLFGALVGLLVIVPLLPMAAVIGATLATFFTGDGSRGLAALGVLILGILMQAVEAYVLTPLILGKRLEVGFRTSLLSTIVFGVLFGFVGVVFAVPLAAVGKILGKELIGPMGKRRQEKKELPKD